MSMAIFLFSKIYKIKPVNPIVSLPAVFIILVSSTEDNRIDVSFVFVFER